MKSNSTLHNCWQNLLAVLTIIGGILISMHLQSRVAHSETTAARLTAETLRLNTEQELTLFVEVLESVRALHALSAAVDQGAMNEFIEKGLVHQHDVLGAFGLAQRIDPHVRSLLEMEAAKQGTGYRVVQLGTGNKWIPSKPKPAYYPLTWQSQTDGLSIPIGFDFSSENTASKTIKKIEQTRRTSLVASGEEYLRLVILGLMEPGPQPSNIEHQASSIENASHWVFAPILPQRIPNTVIGFAIARLNPEAVLERVTARSQTSAKLRLTAIAPSDSKETIHFVNGAWHYRCPINAIDTLWLFECSLPVDATSRRSLITLIAGLIITTLITSQLLILGNRTRKIEAKVRIRTEDLRVANIHLEENLRERARMEEEMNDLTTRERRRIGSDLHDSLGQKLTGAVFLSRSLMNHLEADVGDQRSEVRSQRSETGGQRSEMSKKIGNQKSEIGNASASALSHAETLNETLKSSVAQVRDMASGLAPVALNNESLSEALKQLSREMTALYDTPCELSCLTAARSESPTNSAQPLNQKTKEQLYLIAREAVNNAAKHAQAERITIHLNDNTPNWTLRITDNGKGLQVPIHPNSSPKTTAISSGMGIRIMRHRTHIIGATFTIQSTPGEGTCISVESTSPPKNKQQT